MEHWLEGEIVQCIYHEQTLPRIYILLPGAIDEEEYNSEGMGRGQSSSDVTTDVDH